MEETTVSPVFLKGFNQGYLMQQHKPELGAKLMEQADTGNEYWHGFESGAKEYNIEQSKDKDVSKATPDHSPDMD